MSVQLNIDEYGVWNATSGGGSNAAPNDNPPEPPTEGSNPVPFNGSHGQVTYSGFLNTDNLDLLASVDIDDISIGTIFGSLKDGIELFINLQNIKGKLHFFLRYGNEIHLKQDIRSENGTSNEEVKLFQY